MSYIIHSTPCFQQNCCWCRLWQHHHHCSRTMVFPLQPAKGEILKCALFRVPQLISSLCTDKAPSALHYGRCQGWPSSCMAAFSLRFCARLFYSSGIRWENSGSASMSKSSSSSSVEDYFVPPESVRGCTVLDRSAFLVNSDRCLLRAGGKSPLHFN